MSCATSRSAAPIAALTVLVAMLLPADGAELPGAVAHAAACLPGERGYFQASLRGALNAELDWRGAGLACQGGVRPQDRGVRLSLQGTVPRTGERLRINIGMAAMPGVAAPGVTPASVTVIVEGANRIYSTQDDSHCAVEALRQEALPAGTSTAVGAAGRPAAWRIAARGYCIDPVPALNVAAGVGAPRLYIDRFDFAAQASFEQESLHDPSAPR